MTTYAVPPITVLLSWLLSETPTALALVGGLVCLVGVALSRRRPRVPTRAVAGDHVSVDANAQAGDRSDAGEAAR